MRRTSILAATALAVAVASLSPAAAVIASSCRGEHAGEASCTFYPAGGYISVGGSSTSQSAVTRVEVLTPTGQVIFGCTGYSFCFAQIGAPVTDPFVELPVGVPLTCRITSAGTGWYSCMSIL